MSNSSESDDFYQTLGRAITAWQHVEVLVYEIAYRLIGPENPRAFSAAFHSAMNFNVRLAMADAAAQITLAEPLLAEWKKLRKRTNSRSKERNHLAHFTSITEFDPEVGSRIYLRPGLSDSKALLRYGSKGMPQYDQKRIGEIRSSFGVLFFALMDFLEKLPPHQSSEETSPRPDVAQCQPTLGRSGETSSAPRDLPPSS